VFEHIREVGYTPSVSLGQHFEMKLYVLRFGEPATKLRLLAQVLQEVLAHLHLVGALKGAHSGTAATECA